ncbi:hypothetical protein CERSUDRAFT_116675 [Gelatoporia subvermispora B]|uniref:Uncharacterized protein n=1 Tax=Ceriporiopsis subvermispora (strain B) TaxID=914234 RepID=M2R8Y8_CERS8|nr:hypothetical protein CERSUDRAFT_116675 [Gelatoporia subvermispora B]
MVVIDEKMMLPPPPPYADSGPVSPPPFPSQAFREAPALGTLSPHILLRIVYEVFPQGRPQGQRKMLYWMSSSLRLVNRAFFIACMHVLRSTFLPAYTGLIRPPYSSDPFPLMSPSATYVDSTLSPIQSLQRETGVLDLFIAVKVREDVWSDDSSLHLEREETFKDLFDLMQPRARLEDLVRVHGVREDVIVVGRPPAMKTKSPRAVQPLSFAVLSVSFSPRRVGLVLTTRERKRTIVDVARTREESLESTAKKLVKELTVWLYSTPTH